MDCFDPVAELFRCLQNGEESQCPPALKAGRKPVATLCGRA